MDGMEGVFRRLSLKIVVDALSTQAATGKNMQQNSRTHLDACAVDHHGAARVDDAGAFVVGVVSRDKGARLEAHDSFQRAVLGGTLEQLVHLCYGGLTLDLNHEPRTEPRGRAGGTQFNRKLDSKIAIVRQKTDKPISTKTTRYSVSSLGPNGAIRQLSRHHHARFLRRTRAAKIPRKFGTQIHKSNFRFLQPMPARVSCIPETATQKTRFWQD